MRRVCELTKFTGDEEGDLFAYIDRVISNPLDLPRNHVHPDSPLEQLGIRSKGQNLWKHSAVEPVDRVVHRRQLHTKLQIPSRKCLDRRVQELESVRPHLFQVQKDLLVAGQSRCKLSQLGHVYGHVGYAFEVEI